MTKARPRIIRLTHDPGWGYSLETILDPIADVQTLTANSVEEVSDACKDAHLLVVTQATQRRLTQEALASLNSVRFLYVTGSGYDPIDPDEARKHNIVLCHNPDFCTHEVAEHALAMMLSVWRKIPAVDRRIRSGAFPIWQEFRPITRIWGKTAGVVGFGRSGRAIASRLKGLGMRVIAYDHKAEHKIKYFKDSGVTSVSFSDLLQEADAITVHVPLTEKTHKMFGAAEFEVMKDTAIFVNTSRGHVVDETALTQALENNVIGAAALDVYEEEPLPDKSPLRGIDNVLLNAHMASTSEESTSLEHLALEIMDVLAGGEPRNPVGAYPH